MGSVGSQRVILRADGPAEEDDSNETNIAVVHPMTEERGAAEDRLIMMIGIWRES